MRLFLKAKQTMQKLTIFNAYNQAKKALQKAGIESYGFEARQIIRHITGLSNSEIISKCNEPLTPYQQMMYNSVIERRTSRYPLQYILGEWSFYGLDFYVGEGVLCPRPDTETLVNTALEFLKDKPKAEVIDLCSGSGCIAIAVAKNSDAAVTAVEKYDTPFTYLEKNIERNGANVTAIKQDIYAYVPEKKYDLILSNPPYVSADEMETIDAETAFEPDTALYGGEDGLSFYRHIAENWKKHLKKGGMLAVEVGINQADRVSDIFQAVGFKNIGTANDLSGVQRVVFGTVE